MWISKKLSDQTSANAPQYGKITKNSDGAMDVSSTGVCSNVRICSPYGYIYSPPTGTQTLLIEASGEQNIIGVSVNPSEIEPGEIKIESQSGAFIYLKNDGSVVINGFTINRNGECV